MKNLFISAVAALAMVAGLSSCSQDRDPVYQQPTEFKVNVPVIQDQYLVLDESNADATVSLVCSQPNYGFAAVANYGAEISLSEEFKDKADGTPDNYVIINSTGTGTSASMLLSQFDIACAMTTLNGWVEDEDYSNAPFQKMYVRATCELNGVEGSRIVSNVVSFNNVKPYYAVAQPGFVYLVGTPQGWVVDNITVMENWMLYERQDGINSKIYYGDFDFPDAGPTFRFYTQPCNWEEEFSIGYKKDDEATSFPEFTGGEWNSAAVQPGKGSWAFPNLPAGHYYIKLDMSKATGQKFYIQDHAF